ncbi:hypothetical protein [Sutcliffiella horikoshii]|uniref:Uncharacterized protein n=1 Tax=Sutcliffiella horikoshii TaxID=79883 RepID=A0A5D4T5K2_9BACI|nr:hypothetical protein [Sutcliffiella horikoshii]TYS69978.1 hypothetical protein FZC75_15150 [Sutcliffiella horikoshii]
MAKVASENKIAERVKFWEEQDQINKEIIPRVIKNHELITDLSMQLDQNQRLIAKLVDEVEKNKDVLESTIRDGSKITDRRITKVSLASLIMATLAFIISMISLFI